jgi:hypothetical protein
MWKISTLFWGTSGICVYSPRRCAPRWINHISPRCLKITYTYFIGDIYQKTSKRNCPSKTIRSNILMVFSSGSTSAVVTTHSCLSIMPCLPYVHHLKGLTEEEVEDMRAFSIGTDHYQDFVKVRLHATICRLRFVFWCIKMSAGAIIHCRFIIKKKFQM